VQPVPKKGKKPIPSNYRPIALLPIISKVMEKAVNVEILKHLETSGIINDSQYGFRHQRSTGDLLAYVTYIWESAIEGFGESQAVALDISKAFDRVWHQALLNKLPCYGFSPRLCLWLTNFLQGRSLQVVVDGASSDVLPTNAGVPQGSILSPTLFLLHINDLLTVTSNPIFSFADDTTVIASFSSHRPISARETQDHRGRMVRSLNCDLERIIDWGLENLVQFNAKKTQKCTFSRKANLACPNIVMSGQVLPSNPAISLLGVTASSNLSWHDHVTDIARAASKKLGFLFRARRYFTSQQLLVLYKAQIRPPLEYCSHIWRSAPKHTLNMLDSVQRRAIRLIGNPALTCSLQSLDHRRTVADLSLFYRYYHGRCSAQLAAVIPPRAIFGRHTRQANKAHPYMVKLDTPRTSLHQSSFFYRTAVRWNSLPASIFPSGYDLQAFKGGINRYLSGAHIAPRVT
jgi:hypothetical protein